LTFVCVVYDIVAVGWRCSHLQSSCRWCHQWQANLWCQ